MGLFGFQADAIERVGGRMRCAFYHDMGLGKTYTGSAKMSALGELENLVVCQASKVDDWVAHFSENHEEFAVFNLRMPKAIDDFLIYTGRKVGVVNYELLIKRPKLVSHRFGCVMFDESSLLQNANSKRTKAAMRLADQAEGLVLLSGTPVDGKYERLWTQMHMLGWNVSEKMFWDHYVDYTIDRSEGFPIVTVNGYKNEARLKSKLRSLGCDFLKTCEVMDLPEQRFIRVQVPRTQSYGVFKRDRVIEAYGREFVGDSTFSNMTCARYLAGAFSEHKLAAFSDILSGTSGRVVVFYNFDDELKAIYGLASDRHRCVINGRSHSLEMFRRHGDCVAFVQYQAGAMGLNMQEAQYTLYFSPPLASSLFEQSKKRTHRVGQDKPCTYYELVSTGTIEEDIYRTLAMRQDYTEQLFEKGN